MRPRLLAVLTALCIALTAASAYAAPAKTPPLLQNDIQQLPASYLDGWNKLGGTLLSIGENVYDGQGNKVLAFNTGTKLGSLQISQAMKVYDVLNAVYNGQWEKVAGQAAEDFISKVWPLFGSYMALHGAVKISFEAILANWTQDLYQTEAYKDVVKELNKAVVNQAINQKPYLPSFFLKPGSEGYMAMKAMEDKMYTSWMNTAPYIELDQGDNFYLITRLFGRVPVNERETFDGFLKRAIEDQKGYIITTYERVREDTMHEAMRKFYERTVADLKKQQKMSFFVIGTRDNYGGRLIEGPSGPGDVLAFESNLFVPFIYNGESTRLVWQVYKADGTPVEGLQKITGITDGDRIHNARLRFRIDNLPVGEYYAQLSRCINADCQSRRDVFTVGTTLKVSRIYLSQDQAGTRRINRDPLSREAEFLQTDYTGGAETVVHGELTITDSSGKTVFTGKTDQTPAGNSSRMSFSLSGAPLQEGIPYSAKTTLSTSGDKTESEIITFTPKFYPLELSGPFSTEEGRRTAYDFKAPSQMITPFRLDTQKNAGEVTQVNNSRLYFTPKVSGNRTLSVVLVDSLGRKAAGFKQVAVDIKLLKPPTKEDIAAAQPKVTYVPPPAAPKPAPGPQTGAALNPSVSGPEDYSWTGFSRQELTAKGFKWMKNELDFVGQRLQYTCDNSLNSVLAQAYSNVTSEQAFHIGGWSVSGALYMGKRDALSSNLFFGILDIQKKYVAGSLYSDCNLEWIVTTCEQLSNYQIKRLGMGTTLSAYVRKAPQKQLNFMRMHKDRNDIKCCVNNDCNF